MRISMSVMLITVCVGLTAGCSAQPVRGRLAPCPASPNCVCSRDSDPAHAIACIAYRVPAVMARQLLLQVLTERPRTRIITAEAHYLHAECRSAIFGFVDDVEFLLEAQRRCIACRSAARRGWYDFGVNRRRIEAVRRAFGAAEQAALGAVTASERGGP